MIFLATLPLRDATTIDCISRPLTSRRSARSPRGMPMRAVAFDFGTANGRRDSACSMGLAWIDDGTVTAVEEHLIRPPDMRFSRFNIGIHGIRPEDVADAPGFADLWPSLKLRLAGRLVLAHNAQFDIGVLCAVLSRFGLPWPEASYLCTVHVARRSWPGLSAYKLPVVAAHLRIPLQHHAAGSDADAAARSRSPPRRRPGPALCKTLRGCWRFSRAVCMPPVTIPAECLPRRRSGWRRPSRCRCRCRSWVAPWRAGGWYSRAR